MHVHWRLSGLLLLVTALLAVAAPSLVSPALAAPAVVPAADRPAWQALPLVNARTGQSFTLADLAGKTVYVEPMATWCTNCRQQMGTIRDDLLARLDPDRTILLGLSVETDLPREDLAAYVDEQGFSWTFAVMTPELLQQLAQTFGLTITNPPAVPHFLIGPDGTTSDLRTGFHSADELLGELTSAGGAGQ
jgi:thiol-disulfide isomerase/thioredoxin